METFEEITMEQETKEEDKNIEKIQKQIDNSNDMVEKLKASNKELAEANAERERLLNEVDQEGKADAVAEQPKEETPKEYAKRIMGGN